MKSFTIYNTTTADFRSGYVANDSDLPDPQAGEALIDGVAANPQTQRVDITQTPPAVVDK